MLFEFLYFISAFEAVLILNLLTYCITISAKSVYKLMTVLFFLNVNTY
jgi:hypothetical protein